MDDWSNYVWQMRVACHLTQEEAARVCFVSVRTWRNWEQARTEPPEHIKDGVRDALAQEQIAYLGARLAASSSSSRSRPKSKR